MTLQIGLASSSGGTKGIAHIGLLEEDDEHIESEAHATLR